jgi:hypothetical protein
MLIGVCAMNDSQTLVGQLRQPLAASPHASCGFTVASCQDLGTLGGPHSNGLFVNENNQVVGTAHIDHQATHAFLGTNPAVCVYQAALQAQSIEACSVTFEEFLAQICLVPSETF